jgi:4-amino-4-deoxy-L-arabinose transferase-like glycosyltransferase
MKKKKTKKAAKRSEADRSTEPYVKHFAIILAVGILVRIIYNVNLTNNIFLGNYTADSLALHTWATMIFAGKTENEAFFRAPLFPHIVALLYRIFGVSPWPVIVFQNLLGLLTGIVSYFFARRLFGSTVAFWAGLVVVVYPTLIFFEGETMITTLSVLLYTLTAYRLLLAVHEPTARKVVIAGVVFGLAAITRPTILPLVIIFPMALLVKHGIRHYRKAASKTLVFAAALMIPILPVTLTNLIKGGEFVLISTQGGANFYIGNNREADGITVFALGPLLRAGPYRDNIWTSSVDQAERLTGKKLTQSEVSSFWYRETFKEMKNDPRRAIGLLVRKFYLFWHGQEIYNNRPLYFTSEYSWLMKVLLWKKIISFPSGILFPLMFLGLILAFVKGYDAIVPASFLLLFAVAVSLFFVCSRFRQPIVPLAIIFGMFALHTLKTQLLKNRKAFALSGIILVLLIAGLNCGGNIDSKTNLSQFHASIGTACINKRNFTKGITHLERSLEISPRNISAYEALGQAYMSLGKLAQAERVYKQGIEHYPAKTSFHYYLGIIYHRREDFEKAKEHYQLTLKYSPESAHALSQLGSIFEQQNQLDSALYYYQQLVRIQFNDAKLKGKIEELKQALKASQ